ncbi:FAD/NAD(P)-dependent oxidoreductase [Streptomyces lunaelactis]|uniref:FAD/NAD(P)-dependent oxidoreductase n=1 Tax=Streptomyces lunaelactis TaxID=1535768 RepID=UPI0015847459|nr:NAD(P)/FAD-dependent oxidoreductase [Streptomyces lunaelactis]NUK21288.1 FAD-dependent oxidoreductase [Streptomyces lunaelactis]
MSSPTDALAVIGAGPAGLAAALTAADHGITVTLIDAAPQPGGQFYRQPAAALGASRPHALPHHRRTWTRLRTRLDAHREAHRIRYLPDRHIWSVEPGFTLHTLTADDEPETFAADALLLATGAYEKALPFPGWTLPGVVTAGGAQAMLKGGLVLPGRRAVVAGTGPLLLPVATGLAAAGARVAALVEAADPRAYGRHARIIAAHPGKLAEAAAYAARLVRHRVPVLTRHTVLAAHGTDRVEAVTVAALDADGRVRPGTERRIVCDTLAVGHGLLPHTDLAGALGCRTDPARIVVDAQQRTDVPGVWAAGEATGVGGAALALAEGEIAGRSVVAHLTGERPRTRSTAAKSRTALRQFAAALDAVHAPPAHWSERVTDDTLVCRCEEVTAGTVRAAVTELGAADLRTVKLFTQAGMGWCQGRVCGPGVTGVAGCPPDVVRRPFARPVPLSVLARTPRFPEGRQS